MWIKCRRVICDVSFCFSTAKTITETASVVLEDADESYDPAADPYLPTQPQFTQPFTGMLYTHLSSNVFIETKIIF